VTDNLHSQEEPLAAIRRSFDGTLTTWDVPQLALYRLRLKVKDDVDRVLMAALDDELLRRQEGRR
jgi:hypothetical protein